LVPAVRLSRRGRLLITFMVSAAALTLAVVLATSVSAAAPQIDAPQINHVTTVSAGQTLSEVAAAELPDLPISEGVARIQFANGLNTSQVQAGQSLLIPAM
jgi:predicted outer membrane protein